jgi:hypothetical protein
MPMVNPLNPPNVNEVLRRDKALREESLRRESGYDDEPPAHVALTSCGAYCPSRSALPSAFAVP